MADRRARPVVLPPELLERYRRVSLYNSPYTAHDEGRAADLYPPPGTAPSPVAGEVLDVRSVAAPPKPYAEAEDHLILIDVEDGVPRSNGTEGSESRANLTESGTREADRTESGVSGPDRTRGVVSGPDRTGSGVSGPDRTESGVSRQDRTERASDGGLVARVLHVDPGVEPGDRVTVGDDLGRTIRSGFFAPWVGDHLHVGFRTGDANHYRASGSIRVEAAVPVEPLPWDGRGTVVEQGDTYVVLDRPAHPAPGERWAGIAADGGGVLDGGFPHYDGGGLLARDGSSAGGSPNGAVELLGTRIGTAAGRTVEWADRRPLVDGERITGLSFYLGRDRAGAKLVWPGHDLEPGDEVAVGLQ